MTSRSHTIRRKRQDPPRPQDLCTCIYVFLTTLPIARSAQLSFFYEYLFGRDLEGSGVVCLVVLDWCVLEGLRKTLKNRSHDRRCPGGDWNRGFPNTEHECCRFRGVVTRENTFLLFTTSRPRTSTLHNLVLNIYKKSSALKRNLKTISNCSNGTRDSHSVYSMMLRTAGVVIVCVRMLLWHWFKQCLLILYDKFCIQIFRLVWIYENK